MVIIELINATVPSCRDAIVIKFTLWALSDWNFWWHFVYISPTLIKHFRTKLNNKYGGWDRYPPLQMCYPDLWSPLPFRNSDLWVTLPVGDPDLSSPLLSMSPGYPWLTTDWYGNLYLSYLWSQVYTVLGASSVCCKDLPQVLTRLRYFIFTNFIYYSLSYLVLVIDMHTVGVFIYI